MLQSFLNSVQSVAIILILTAAGYFLAWKGWLNKDAKSFLSKMLMQMAVPCMCVYSLRSRLTIDMLKEAGPMLLVPFVCISASFIASFIFAKLLKLPRKTFGVFVMMGGLSNTMFIGFPMCTELFGSDATSYVIMYYMVSTCFTQGVGMTFIRWAGEGDSTISVVGVIKKVITTPTVVGVTVGILVVLLDIQLPALAMSFGKYMNQLVTPLAMFVTGKIIYDIGLKNLRMDKVLTMALLVRFVISPAMCIALCNVFGITGMAKGVFVIQAAMPVVTQTVVASSEYGADEETAAQGCAISTLASFIVIPILMLMVG